MDDKKHVLIVDDDIALRKLYQVELSRSFEVATAEDGEDCLRKAAEHKPDLILLDVMMPKKDGIATLRGLRNNPALASIPVIMLTNFGQEDFIKDALSLGAVDYVLKYKITPAEMSAKIAGILNPSQVQL